MIGRSLLQLPQKSCSLLLPTSRITESTDPFQPDIIWQTFDALKGVNRPEEIDWKSIPSIQTVAWKTGANYGFQDAQAAGITSRYAVGIWVGNTIGEGKPGLVDVQTAGPVLFDIFNLLPSSPWLIRPAGIFVEAEVYREPGHLRGRLYDETDTLLVLSAELRAETCPYYHLVTLSANESQRTYENCANAEPTSRKSWFILPSVWKWYYG